MTKWLLTTNDEFETVLGEFESIQKVSDYTGDTVNSIRCRICRKSWKNYKVIKIDDGVKADKKMYAKMYQFRVDRTEYRKKYYKKQKQLRMVK